MKRICGIATLCVGLLPMIAGSVFAHHSAAMFDNQKTITVVDNLSKAVSRIL